MADRPGVVILEFYPPTSAVNFLARYFSISALELAKSGADNDEDDELADLFERALRLKTVVGKRRA